jgi:hypothetical protein
MQHQTPGGVTLGAEILGASPMSARQHHAGHAAELAAMLPPVDASSRDVKRLSEVARRIGEMTGAQVNQQGQSRAIYAWNAAGSRVEGPTVYLIEALAHEYGHLWASTKIDHDGGDVIYITATVVDRVKGNVYQRPHVHELTPPPGKFANNQEQAARWRTMQLQKAFSKSMRTTLEHALPRWYIDAAVDAAKAVVSMKVGDARKAAEDAAAYFLREFSVGLTELEEHLGAEKPLWTASDILALRELIKSLKNAQTTVAAVFGARDTKSQKSPKEKPKKPAGLAALTDQRAEGEEVSFDAATGEVLEAEPNRADLTAAPKWPDSHFAKDDGLELTSPPDAPAPSFAGEASGADDIDGMP